MPSSKPLRSARTQAATATTTDPDPQPQPQTQNPTMSDKDNPKPNPYTDGTLNAVVNDDGSVTTYDENGCYITRYGGDPTWRNNNPANLKAPCNGSIGQDANGLAIFSSPEAGIAEFMQQVNSAPGTQPDTIGAHIAQVMSANGIGDYTPVFNAMWAEGLDPRSPWQPTGTGGGPAGVDGNYPDANVSGGFVHGPRMIIQQAIEALTGADDAATGDQTAQQCPGHDSDYASD